MNRSAGVQGAGVQRSGIRRAEARDVAAVTELIHLLAEHQRAADECTVTEEQIHEALFAPNPSAFAHVACDESGTVVGIAVWFLNYSTWDGSHGIYLEDLYVRPTERGAGHGKALLATLAQECVSQGYTRLSWSVANWNTPSIAFYESLDAKPQNEWTTYRLAGTPLQTLAAEVG
ncbi:MAG: GNAT family N-acetyltransferase [Rhodococcus sp.]|nr:GNAT family N-acetyltransferase [Rhodococcus sp. (in: high G+C Gram-positive bacteria)]